MLNYIFFYIYKIFYFVVRPKTFGVKILIIHIEKILLVQHSYGNKRAWHLPGGGYSSTLESSKDAACREVKEELGLNLSKERLEYLMEYKTNAEHKKDIVDIFVYKISSMPEIKKSNEITNVEWFTIPLNTNVRTYSITLKAINTYLKI